MLSYQWHGTTGTPVVFLHGLLGSQQDWAEVLGYLQKIPNIRPLTLDLPCHAQSQTIDCKSFSDVRQQLHRLFRQQITEPFYLVGYSLGGRIALDYAFHQPNKQLKAVLLEGANIGLSSQAERTARWQQDQHWAVRFRTEPLENVLNDWYQQPVFADLSPHKRSVFIQKRQQNNGERIATMLEATSLAKQPFLGCAERQNVRFLIGEWDQKFRQMAEKYQLNHQLISKAGHNAHQQNPREFSQKLLALIEEQNGITPLS